MEIPIRVVVAFLVIMVVGSTIIIISKDLLTDTSNRVKDIGKTASKDKIIEKTSFTLDEVSYLAQQCYDNSYGLKKEDLCYILKSSTTISNIASIAGSRVRIGSGTTDSKTLYISFSDPNIIISDH